MKKLIFIIFATFLSINFYGQPGERDIPCNYKFKFYDIFGKIITPNSKDYKIKIDFEPVDYKKKDSLLFINNEFICKSHVDAEIRIEVMSRKGIMKINTVTSIDSIPYLVGKYQISNENRALLSIKTNKETIIDKKKWNFFKVNDFGEIKKECALKRTNCKYWKIDKNSIKIAEESSPEILGIFSNRYFSKKIYAWSWNNLYVSADNCKNWLQIFSTKNPKETPVLSFIDKKTLILIVKNKYRKKMTDSQREVYTSQDDGITWKLNLQYTEMQMSYVYFKNTNEGFAFCDNYDEVNRQMRTCFYTTKDGG